MHLNKNATYILNQREGLKGLCLKTAKGELFNVSENLNYAFFWPSNTPESLELKNISGKHYAYYNAKDFSIANDTKDLAAVYYHKYRENLPDTSETYTSEMNEQFLTRYAATVSVSEESNAWKFDHWEQFTDTEWDKVEFCFHPIFKLDRVNEYWHMCPALSDRAYSSVGYTDNPNRNMNVSNDNFFQNRVSGGGWADRNTQMPSNYYGAAFRTTYRYRGASRVENFDASKLARGEIPTVDYYQETEQQNWRWHYVGHAWDYGYGIDIHGCSHRIGVGSWWFEGIGSYLYRDSNGMPHYSYTPTWTPVYYSGKTAGSTLPQVFGDEEDPHEERTKTVVYSGDIGTKDTANGYFTLERVEELTEPDISSEEMYHLLDYKDDERPILFEFETSPGTWYVRYNNDVEHTLKIKLIVPPAILKERTYTRTFDIKGEIHHVKYLKEDDSYVFDKNTYIEAHKNETIVIISDDIEHYTITSLSGDSNTFSYVNENGEETITSSVESKLQNDIYNGVSSVFSNEMAKFENGDYKRYSYTDKAIDPNYEEKKKYQFIKVDDYHYKIPYALIREFSLTDNHPITEPPTHG